MVPKPKWASAAVAKIKKKKKDKGSSKAAKQLMKRVSMSMHESSNSQSRKTLEIDEAEDAEYARDMVRGVFSGSSIISVDQTIELPTFAEEELKVGKIMGTGSFGVVTEVKKIDLLQDFKEFTFAPQFQKGREFIAQHCRRKEKKDTSCRYAIKKLNDETIQGDYSRYIQGMIDLGVETHFLSVIEHPHIIKMRGFAACGPYDKNYFIVVDRLYDVLDKKLLTWGKRVKKFKSRPEKLNSIMEERFEAAYGLSAALVHLHGQNIIYRDLKPDNIGFDIRGDVKIFDFGLATEVHPQNVESDGTYKLSVNTGSPRYMAPEVALGKPYNFKSDIYSFSLLLWEIIALQKPFAEYTLPMIQEKVYKGGERPPTEHLNCPDSVVSLIKNGWSEDLGRRPFTSSATAVLQKVLEELCSADSHQFDLSRRRSTHVWEQSRRELMSALQGSTRSLVAATHLDQLLSNLNFRSNSGRSCGGRSSGRSRASTKASGIGSVAHEEAIAEEEEESD